MEHKLLTKVANPKGDQMKLFLTIFMVLFTGNVFAADDVCVSKYPNSQAYENVLFRSIDAFTHKLGIQSDTLPVTMGAANPDGLGNCHLMVFLGKNSIPAGKSINAITNYQSFINTQMWSLGFSVSNRLSFIALFRQNIKDAKLPGLDNAKLDSDEVLNQTLGNIWNNQNTLNQYGYAVMTALNALGFQRN
jgi:hypothetical protein